MKKVSMKFEFDQFSIFPIKILYPQILKISIFLNYEFFVVEINVFLTNIR